MPKYGKNPHSTLQFPLHLHFSRLPFPPSPVFPFLISRLPFPHLPAALSPFTANHGQPFSTKYYQYITHPLNMYPNPLKPNCFQPKPHFPPGPQRPYILIVKGCTAIGVFVRFEVRSSEAKVVEIRRFLSVCGCLLR